jgi:hypothetical protein
MAETVSVRHDAEFEVTFHVTANTAVPTCDRTSIVRADMLNAHLTVGSAMYVGNSLHRHGAASYSLRMVNPERDTLKDGELCTCDDCERGVYG